LTTAISVLPKFATNSIVSKPRRWKLRRRNGRGGCAPGDWGWAACFADLNLDGTLDLVHVNGWPQGSDQFRNTPARLFLGGAGGRFLEASASLGFEERGNGRGLVCFDYDGDGDIDLFVMNNSGPARLWRNDGAHALGHYLSVSLEGVPPNTDATGARISVTAGGRRQVRTVRAGSNYVSQDPAQAHFGLGNAQRVDELIVDWPDGSSTSLTGLRVDQRVTVRQRDVESVPSESGCSVASAGR
jgi:hypothetical protein